MSLMFTKIEKRNIQQGTLIFTLILRWVDKLVDGLVLNLVQELALQRKPVLTVNH